MVSSTSDFLHQFKERLRQLGLKSGDNVLIAWSGGLDSTLLVYLMKHYSSSNVFAAYFNHRLRSAAELQKEMNLLHAQAHDWEVPLFIGSAEEGEIEALKKSHRGSMEEWARIERYRFLEKLKSEHQIDYLLTAHHQDDEAETLLFRFLQGASVMGLSGLEGKQPFQSTVIRPFLCFTRNDVGETAKNLGLRWSKDSSNLQKHFLRNRIRAELMPVVENIFPSFKESLHTGAEKNAFYAQGIQQQLQKLSIREIKGIQTISLADFQNAPSYLRLEALYTMADRLLRGQQHGVRIPYRFFRDLLEGSSNLSIRREGHGLILRSWKGDLQMLRKDKDVIFHKRSHLPLDEWLICGEWKLKFCINSTSSSSIPLQGNPEDWKLRSREEGDVMGKPGRLKKRLSAFPRDERPFIPLLVRGKEVQALIYGKRDRILKDLAFCRNEKSPGFYLNLEHNDAD